MSRRFHASMNPPLFPRRSNRWFERQDRRHTRWASESQQPQADSGQSCQKAWRFHAVGSPTTPAVLVDVVEKPGDARRDFGLDRAITQRHRRVEQIEQAANIAVAQRVVASEPICSNCLHVVHEPWADVRSA